MKRAIAALLLAPVLAWGQSYPSPTFASVNVAQAVTFSANNASPGAAISPNFVGWSEEFEDFLNGYMTTANTSWLGMVKLLGTNGVLRVGGSTCDLSTTNSFTQAQVNALQQFVAAMGGGWSVLFCVNLQAQNNSLSATQAGYVNNAFGSNATIDLGNEDLDGGQFPNNAAYIAAWNSMYAAVTAAVPGVQIDAMHDGNFQTTRTVVPSLTPGLAGLALLDYHWYGLTTYATTPALLYNSLVLNSTGLANFFANDNIWSTPNKTRLAETNTVGAGGVDGISNVLASATWTLGEDILFATHGWQGTNVHNSFFQGFINGKNATYNSFVLEPDGGIGAGADFYALLLFSMVEGKSVLPLTVTGNYSGYSIAVQGANGKAQILIANTDTVNVLVAQPTQTASWTSGSVMMLTGPSCTSKTVTLGGSTVGEGGVWSPVSVPTVPNGGLVSIPPCSSALITLS